VQKLSFQFGLDIPFAFAVARQVALGVFDKAAIARELRVGVDKAACFLRWVELLALTRAVVGPGGRSFLVTGFHDALQQVGEMSLTSLELLYAVTCRRHMITSFVINEVAYHNRHRGFSREDACESIKDYADQFHASLPTLKNQVTRHLKSLVHRRGFGNLGVVRKAAAGEGIALRGEYTITPLEPDPLAAAYVIYANWPSHTAKVAISETVSGRNSVGRIFFLNEFQVMSILQELGDRDLVKIETAAGLDQIGRNPKITLEDILQMIVTEAKSEA